MKARVIYPAYCLAVYIAFSGCDLKKDELKEKFSEERAQSVAENVMTDYITNDLAYQDAVQFAQTGKLVNLPGGGLAKIAVPDTLPLTFNPADSSWAISVTKPKGSFTYSLYLYNKNGKKQTLYVKGNTPVSTYSLKWTTIAGIRFSRTGSYQSANTFTASSDLKTAVTMTGVNESATQVVVNGNGSDTTFSSWTGIQGKKQESNSKLTYTYKDLTFPKSSDTSYFPVSGSALYNISHTFAHAFSDSATENGKTVTTTATITFTGGKTVTITVDKYTFLLNLETKTLTRVED